MTNVPYFRAVTDPENGNFSPASKVLPSPAFSRPNKSLSTAPDCRPDSPFATPFTFIPLPSNSSSSIPERGCASPPPAFIVPPPTPRPEHCNLSPADTTLADSMLRSVKRRQDTWSRTRAPMRAWREKMLARVLNAARAQRATAADARRAARLLAQTASKTVEDDTSDSDESLGFEDDDAEVGSLTESQISEILRDIEMSIEEERKSAERDALEELERGRAAELEQADREVEELLLFQAAKLSIDDDCGQFLLCPVCRRDGLLVRSGVLFCKCGVRFDGGAVENLSIEMVRERMAQIFGLHAGKPCEGELQFEKRERFGFGFLHAGCGKCGMDEIVL